MATAASTAVQPPLGKEYAQTEGLDPNNVFVKHLPAEMSDTELTALFSEHGEVISSKIMIDPLTKKSLGYGFVRFAFANDARFAIQAMDGHKIGTKRLLCKLANSPKEREAIPEVSAGKATSDDSPRPQVQRASVRVSRTATTNDRRAGSGHQPTTPTSAAPERIPITTMTSSRTLPGVSRSSSTPNLPAKFAPSKSKVAAGSSPRHVSTNLYVKSLLPTDTEETLEQLFGEYGEIEACKVMIDRATGDSRCNGFVRFKNQEDATTAKEAMNGYEREDSILLVKYADDERQKELRRRARLANPPLSGMTSRNSASELSIGKYGRNRSPEESAEMMRRLGPPTNTFVPWPYVWPNGAYAPPPPQIIDVSAWLVMYSTAGTTADGYTSPRGMQMPHFYPPHPPMYYHYDPASSADWNRSYARTAPLPSTSAPWGETPNVPSSGPSSAPNS